MVGKYSWAILRGGVPLPPPLPQVRISTVSLVNSLIESRFDSETKNLIYAQLSFNCRENLEVFLG